MGDPALDKEANLYSIFNDLCIKYKLDIEVNPEHYDISSPCSLDVEHDEEGNLVGIGIYDGKRCLYFTRIDSNLRSCISKLSIIAHNGISDLDLLRYWGIPVSDSQLVWDTMLIGHIQDSSLKSYGLKDMARRELALDYPSYDDIVGRKTAKQKNERKTLDKWPVDIVSRYNALDCYATYQLYQRQVSMLHSGRETSISDYFNQIEKPLAFILADMSNRGIRVDLEYLKTLKSTLEAQKSPLEHEIKNELGDINLNSPKQLLEALHAKEIYPEFKGKSSTDKRALSGIQDSKIVYTLLSFSEIETLLSSFVYPYLKRNTEVVYPFFNQCGTRTGRLSCSNPNLLQIPKRTENGKLVRRMFIPREGMSLGDCDFGQIEPRVLAHLSKDPVLCQMFNDGIDFHTFTAERLSIDRERAKVLNLSVGYRATRFSVQRQLGGSLDDAQKQIDAWWGLFPSLRRWQERTLYDSKRSGFCTTFMGRRIRVDGLNENHMWRREAAERQLINNITQGSAAEIMKMSMLSIIKSARYGKNGFGLLVQIYDELLFESEDIRTDITIIQHCMENAVKLDVPLTVNCTIGPNWADVKGEGINA